MRESGFQAQNKFSRKKIRGVLEKSPVTILTSYEGSKENEEQMTVVIYI